MREKHDGAGEANILSGVTISHATERNRDRVRATPNTGDPSVSASSVSACTHVTRHWYAARVTPYYNTTYRLAGLMSHDPDESRLSLTLGGGEGGG